MEDASARHEARVADILERVRRIPEGSVRAFGEIDPAAPRLVGRVLSTVDDEVPWHRVVRADGSLPKGERQRARLVAEGVAFRGEKVDRRQR